MFGGGSVDDALALLDDFDAAMDEPWMLMYEEVMTAFPDSKLLTRMSIERCFAASPQWQVTPPVCPGQVFYS